MNLLNIVDYEFNIRHSIRDSNNAWNGEICWWIQRGVVITFTNTTVFSLEGSTGVLRNVLIRDQKDLLSLKLVTILSLIELLNLCLNWKNM